MRDETKQGPNIWSLFLTEAGSGFDGLSGKTLPKLFLECTPQVRSVMFFLRLVSLWSGARCPVVPPLE